MHNYLKEKPEEETNIEKVKAQHPSYRLSVMKQENSISDHHEWWVY